MAEAPEELALPAIISSNMVLQRNAPVPIWGTAAPGKIVSVTFKGQTKTANANAAGAWRVLFRNLPPGEAGEMVVTDGSSTRRITNILVGDVWLCSGQSNMEWPLELTNNAEQEIRQASFDQIRLFTVAKKASVFHTGDVEGKWVVCRAEEARQFSAVGYFFGRSIHTSEQAPVGLIDATWGGTPAEAWTPRETLVKHPETKSLVDAFDFGWQQLQKEDPELAKAAPEQITERFDDKGNKGEPQGWARPGFDDSAWAQAKLPSTYAGLGLFINGTVWFRRVVDVPAAMAGKPAVLSLGVIDDFDTTYLNGVKAGSTDESNSATPWNKPRAYEIPPGTLKEGRNVIAVRVHDWIGMGGFISGPDAMTLAGAGQTLSLAGDWKMAVEASRRVPPSEAATPSNPNAPAALWSGMIRPLVPFALKGAIWYQGESNVGRAAQYRVLFPAMIRSWRQAWGLGDFPFLYVELANYLARAEQPGDSAWAELREAQGAALDLPNTGVAVIIDIGEADDIHPRNKRDAGERLAMAARTITYRGEPAGNSPSFTQFRLDGARAVLSFKDGIGLRTSDGAAPAGFSVMGPESKWVWADARIQGPSIIVEARGVGQIRAIRYGWADNPNVNVVNQLGLPLRPFRTDRPVR